MKIWRKPLAEAIGTFALVFVGTGAIIADELSGGLVSYVGIALAFGLVVMAMVYALGDVSGAHLNPAVTFGFWLARKLPADEALRYVAAQSAGALFASGTLRLLFLAQPSLGATLPAGGVPESFAVELIPTFFLVFVILGVTQGSQSVRPLAGLAIRATVALGALFGGTISGGSMNPARSLGPAVFSGQLGVLWLYLAAPLAGASLAVHLYRCVREPGCCR